VAKYNPKNNITSITGIVHLRYINQQGKITDRTFCGINTYLNPKISTDFNSQASKECKKCYGTGKGNMGYKP